MDKVYFWILPFVLVVSTVVYVGYFLTGLDNPLDFLFMPDCAHPLMVLGFILTYYIYRSGKVKKRYYSFLSYVCALLIGVGISSLFYAFYVKNFTAALSLFCHISMVVVGVLIFSKNINNLKMVGFFVASFYLSIDLISDLFLETRHPYIYSNQDIINGFAVRIFSIALFVVFLFVRKQLKKQINK